MALVDSLLTAVFERVAEALGALRAERVKARDDAWAWFMLNLDTLKDVATAHISAINIVVEPIVATGDIDATVSSYRALVNTPTFPQAYEEINGALDGTYHSSIYTDAMRDPLNALKGSLYPFQRAVFFLHDTTSSWQLADTYEDASSLHARLQNGETADTVAQLAAKVNDDLLQAYTFFKTELEGHPNAPVGPEWPGPPQTASDVVDRLRLCCRQWQRCSQFELYGARGIGYWANLLKTMKHNG